MPSNPNGARSKPTAWLTSVAAVALMAVATPARALDYTLSTQYGPIGSGAGQFQGAADIDLSPFNGQLYIVDQANHRVQRWSTAGVYLGSFGTLGNGNGQLTRPSAAAIDVDGNVYVADQDNNRIAKFTATGTHLANYGSFGSGDGQFNTVSMRMGIAYSAKNSAIYVTDGRNNRVQRFGLTGAFSSKWGTAGSGNGQFNNPQSVAVDKDGLVYVADTGNNRIQRFNAVGSYQTKWGSAGSGNGQFSGPVGVSVDATGIVYVSEGDTNDRIQAFTPTGGHLATYGTPGGSALRKPLGAVAADDGTVWVVDALGDTNKIVSVLTPTYASDNIAPVTTISQTPAKNSFGWNKTGVTVTLGAIDEIGGSRVKEIHYTVNMGTEQVVTYTAAPSATTSFNLPDTGVYSINYWSVDFMGNVETFKTYTVSVDLVNPVVNGFVAVGELWLEASDADSGIDTIEYRLDNAEAALYTGPVAIPAGTGVVRYWTRDKAGNVSATRYLTVGSLLKSLIFAPASVSSGATTVLTLTLNSAAPAGGLPLTLSSSLPGVIAVPATITVPSGATTWSTTITTGTVSTETNASVTAATDSGQTITGSVTVFVPGPKQLTLSPTSVVGGASATGTVSLVAKAPAGGVVVNLTSMEPSVTVPATVTVAGGSSTATFAITTTAVTTDRAALIAAEADGTVAVAALTVRRLTLRSVAVAPTVVVGGRTATGTVTLSAAAPTGGVTVALASSDPSVTLPATVDIAEGTTSATFTINTPAVSADRSASIRATYGGTVVRTTLRVTPARLSAFRIAPGSAAGGTTAVASITLTGPAPAGGLTVGIRSRSTLFALPASVTVAEGETTADFNIAVPYVTANQTATVVVFTTLDSRTATLTAIPTNVASVALNPTSVVGGNTSEFTVTLNGPAPAGGTSVTLAASNTKASVPATATVAEGATSVTVTVNTVAVTSNTSASISAKVTGSTTTKAATLAITKP